jgi:hypothetical protein
MVLLGNIGQQLDIKDIAAELEQLKTGLGIERALGERADELLGRLKRENDELKLYLAALVRLVVSKGLVSADEIRQLVEALDREDGAADGAYDGSIGL